MIKNNFGSNNVGGISDKFVLIMVLILFVVLVIVENVLVSRYIKYIVMILLCLVFLIKVLILWLMVFLFKINVSMMVGKIVIGVGNW